MKEKLKYIIFIFMLPQFSFCQNLNLIYDTVLSNEIYETSGLIFFDSKIYTINDSGNEPYIFQLDTFGNIIKRIFVKNVVNTDWETLAQDSIYFFVGDIGNNNGTRTDLKIYKIKKSDLLTKDSVDVSHIIKFKYGNQNNFSPTPNNTTFDAEAIICLNDTIILFSKNWLTNYTLLYKIPVDIDSCIIFPHDSIELPGMVTGTDKIDSLVFICGYNDSLLPFLSVLNFHNKNLNTFNLANTISISQTESIALKDKKNFFLTSEKFIFNNNNTEYIFESKFYKFEISNYSNTFQYAKINNNKIYPNPVISKLHLENFCTKKKIIIMDVYGKQILSFYTENNTINLKNLKKGIYIIKINCNNQQVYTKKIVKQ